MTRPHQCPYALLPFKAKLEKCVLSYVQLFATLWTVARQAPLSMQFSRQEYWSGLPFPSPGDCPDPGIELRSPALQANSCLSQQGSPLSSLVQQIIIHITNVN